MKIVILILIICIIVGSYIRFSKVEQSAWHLDPELVTENGSRNSRLVNSKNNRIEIYNLSSEDLFSKFDKIVKKDNCRLVFGSFEQGIITYLCRSPIFGFPDYISISYKEIEEKKSFVSIFSRSRFGVYDFGKNKQRVKQWLERLKSIIQES